MYSEKEEAVIKDFIKKERERPAIKKEKVNFPLQTSYTVPFYFADSGRRNQVLICEGRKYIQNNKYGEKIYYKCRLVKDAFDNFLSLSYNSSNSFRFIKENFMLEFYEYNEVFCKGLRKALIEIIKKNCFKKFIENFPRA